MTREQRHYIPILKGRLGEFNALRHVDDGLGEAYTPLIELVPSGEEFGEDGEVYPVGVESSVRKSIERLNKYWPRSRDFIIDVHGIPEAGGVYPTEMIVTHFANRGNQIIPTVKPSDSDESIEALAAAMRKYSYRDVCIRIGGEDLDEREMTLEQAIMRVLDKLEVGPGGIDLVIDFGALHDEQSASFAARIGRLVIMDLPNLDKWKSLTLAAGGFPAALDTVAPETLTDIPRLELAMWRAVRDRLKGRMRTPSFGDYGIAYPVQASGVGFAPAPQLRYTASESWLVLKGRKADRRGNAQFFDICGELVVHPEFTRQLSWGDREIEEKARFAGRDPVPAGAKPGNAMVWRAIGTSHHLAFVIERLARLGEP